jgi:hypothetical protein
MKKPSKATAAPAAKKKQEPVTLGAIGLDQLIPICDGKAAVVLKATLPDGRFDGWLCRPGGEQLERIRIADISEAETRAQALIDKGSL